MLQYKLFCQRVEQRLRGMERALWRAGVPRQVHFNAVGETGAQLMDQLRGEGQLCIGGACQQPVRLAQRRCRV